MAQIAAGESEALGQLYDRYCARALRVASAVCRDPDWAEDAVHNAFVSIWKSRAAYREQRGVVAAWLMSVVRNRAIDIVRANNRIAQHITAGSLETVPGLADTAEQVIARDSAERLLELLDLLPDPQREVITLAFYGGLSHTEIATQLDLPPGTVKGRMRLGLEKLRVQMEAR